VKLLQLPLRKLRLKQPKDHTANPASAGLAFLFLEMDAKEGFKIGYVMKTHGLKGEITMATLPECPDLAGVETLFLERRQQLVPYFVESLSFRGDKAFIKFEDVDTLEQAGELKGSSIFLPKVERPKPARGEFYSDEVIGFEVIDEEHLLGKVKEVVEAGPNRFLALDNDRETLIPVAGPFIKSVNRSTKKIKVELPDGFLDI
jgi:16S rRNA processing protein RimM